ncbi:amino acid transporter [Pseudooceanicola lipolyticus]|uniref:Amino acid transporter n=1 Tax=Pseudooceanicola lipolyticus TaxID=2029104 RepID=A0A2M8IZ32_9RHOB|nr:LysE/ArgO family amino acid transporter [Pseudooceanicola lipolyticus]PJE35754.1 amino acid transporter [Pseudooceanicola lipolyticus]
MVVVFFNGFALGFGLILAIGAQNAFVLRQGLRREHVFAICLTCALSDAALIAVGVAGFGVLVQAAPWIGPLMRLAGAAFLAAYAVMALRAAWHGSGGLTAQGQGALALGPALGITLAFTWLNPHVYLDTVVLVGSVASQSASPFWFGLGAMLASFVFFFSLGYGARLLAPLFARPQAWRVFDTAVGLVMAALACKLLVM